MIGFLLHDYFYNLQSCILNDDSTVADIAGMIRDPAEHLVSVITEGWKLISKRRQIHLISSNLRLGVYKKKMVLITKIVPSSSLNTVPTAKGNKLKKTVWIDHPSDFFFGFNCLCGFEYSLQVKHNPKSFLFFGCFVVWPSLWIARFFDEPSFP